MILGLGIDVVEISRITWSWETYGLRFARKILHPDELIRLEAMHGGKVQFLASRFAAKEAAVKALGTGFSEGVTPQDISVLTRPGGAPEARFHAKALDRFRFLGADTIHISLTHGKETVAAVVILETNA